MKARLFRPWIFFPYKSLKTQIALTLKVLLLWLSNCRKLLIWGCSFTKCKLLIVFLFVYDKNKDTPLWIGSMHQLCFASLKVLKWLLLWRSWTFSHKILTFWSFPNQRAISARVVVVVVVVFLFVTLDHAQVPHPSRTPGFIARVRDKWSL